MSDQTIELLNICNKAFKRYNRTRNPAHKDNKAHGNYFKAKSHCYHHKQLDAHLASLEIVDQHHKHGIVCQIISHIAGDVRKMTLNGSNI